MRRFREVVFRHYELHGRHGLPWRKTKDAYKILVSEVMLQQTQVERVIPFYMEWVKKFPTVQALAAAPLADVLRTWQGLGYNRRAKMLHDAAKVVVTEHDGKMPRSAEELNALPGVGPYTARAVMAFATDQDTVFIETNIRTAVLHHFFADREGVPDAEILAILERALPKGSARQWYSALMDYGAYLKRSGVRLNAKSKSYTKQSKFEGSTREARGTILKALAKDERSSAFLIELLGPDRRAQIRSQLAILTKENLIELSKGKFRLPT